MDTATLSGSPTTTLVTDGSCFRGTLERLASGSDAMAPAEIAKIRDDAIELLGTIIGRYAMDIAHGEVGAAGTGRAGPGTAKHCTGLLYGRIQSGKTVAMISLIAAAMDNGFRVVVVLTSDNVTLVSQTTERFNALDGPIIVDALSPSSWQDDEGHIRKKISRSGVVFVCSKNKTRLDGLIAFLTKIGAPDFPSLVLDDEADQATLDANLAKRVNARKKSRGDVDPTAIYAKVVEELRETLRHHVFLQVTATPYALLLQTAGTALRPSFTRLLEPGSSYTGGEFFFEAHHVDGPEPPLSLIEADESENLKNSADAPEGLRQAIAFFLVSAAAQAVVSAAPGQQNFLCHTSQLKQQHKNLRLLILEYVNRIDDELERGSGETRHRLEVAYEDLTRTLPGGPPLDTILQQLSKRLVHRRVVVVNADTDSVSGPGLNFIVGGNILGRGVTIKNLLVTYYVREPLVGQMDTMLQHARMYGYRKALMPYTRVFLPESLAIRFHEIHKIEGRLRDQLRRANMGNPIPIEFVGGLRPTRRGVLDPDYLDAFEGGGQVWPMYRVPQMSPKDFEAFTSRIQTFFGGVLPKDGGPELVQIPFDALLELVDDAPYDEKKGSSSWVPSALRTVLEKQEARVHGRAYLHTRKLAPRKSTFTTGVLEGQVLARLREADGPVFCAFRKETPGNPKETYWYPTLVFDRGMPNVLVNAGDAE